MKFRLGELFCGPGGIGLAAKQAKVYAGNRVFMMEHVWATDFDEDTCRTYAHNIMPHRPEAVICEDIRKLDLGVLDRISPIDALAFGFPCNDFSVVGKQRGIEGTYGPLYKYSVRALERFQPKWFFAENVGGLRNSNDGKALKTILAELADAGYKIVPHMYRFEEYGVPQARHRIIIIGIRDDLEPTFRIPSPEPFIGMDVSARTALEKPPIPPEASNNELTRQSETVIARLKHIKPGENAFTANIPNHLRLNVSGAKISQIYRRLKPDRPAYTVTGSGGGGTHVYHWAENRALTNRERARLQTFPDNFVFKGGKESVRRQIGMAVPVQGAKVILESILKAFAGMDYPSIPQNIPFDNHYKQMRVI